MRIALISEYNSLTSTGGTEFYTQMLAHELASNGITVVLIAAGAHETGLIEREIQAGKSFYRVTLLPLFHYTKEEIRIDKISRSWHYIEPILKQFTPDLIHVHTNSTFFNIKHLEACRKIFSRVVFTSHVPEHFCLKGDMIQNNQHPCSGAIGMICARCLFSVSFKKGISNLVKGHVKKLRSNLKKRFSLGIEVVCTSGWQREQLILNGFPAEQITIIRQALDTDATMVVQHPFKEVGKLRVGYLGRLTYEKGASLLMSVISHYRNINNIEFVLGIPPNSDPAAVAALQQLMQDRNVKISLLQNITAHNKDAFFSAIDILLIPSFVMETGPIVLLEALIHGKMVLAPDTGGAAEYAKQYPHMVTCYQWNHMKSVIKELDRLTMQHALVGQSNAATFLHGRKQFLERHLALYQKLLAT